MLTETFDPTTEAIINPTPRADAPAVDACIMTFSHVIESFVLANFETTVIGVLTAVNGDTPIYKFTWNGKQFAFFKTCVGAPACAGTLEQSLSQIRTKKYILFGGCGCLDREIARGKVIIPTSAYRDEGTSYHYAPAADYINVDNYGAVVRFMEEYGIPYVTGKTWTTDAFFRETRGNMAKRKAEGCLSVEMECAAVQAVASWRELDLYVFFTSGDLLDAPKWDERRKAGQLVHTQHDAGHFYIALGLADFVTR